MAIPDEDLRPAASGSGILDPLLGAGFFSPNMSLEEIKRRRAIAGALASRRRDFPKTVGEGMTYFGESLADALETIQVGRGEKAYNAKREADFPGATPAAVPPVAASEPPPVTVPPVASTGRPSPAPPAPVGPMARANITQTLAGPPPPQSPLMTANAALTTGAPPVAGPDGATFAEEGPNPPIVSNIRPMQVAQAGGVGTVPGPLAPPVPGPVPPGGIRPTDPAASAPTGRPPEPNMDQPGATERALLLYKQKYRNDPEAVQKAEDAIAPYKQKREQDYAERRKEWELKYGAVLQEEAKERERAYNRPKTELELLDAQRKSARDQYIQGRFGTLGTEHFGKKLDESQKAVENLPASNLAIQNVKTVLPQMMTGSLAEQEMAVGKFLHSVGFPLKPGIVPTEQFKSYIAPILSQMRTAVVGSGPQSEKELAALQQAVGSDIKLEPGSIKGIVETMEKLNLQAALAHQKRLLTFAGNDENDRRMVMNWYSLPMEDLVPKGAIEILRRGRDNPAVRAEFDKEFHTPGLAERVLERGR